MKVARGGGSSPCGVERELRRSQAQPQEHVQDDELSESNRRWCPCAGWNQDEQGSGGECHERQDAGDVGHAPTEGRVAERDVTCFVCGEEEGLPGDREQLLTQDDDRLP